MKSKDENVAPSLVEHLVMMIKKMTVVTNDPYHLSSFTALIGPA